MIKLIQGDCLEKMKEMESNSISSIVTDPPYGISFMGKKWDYDVPSVEIWEECLRVLKPGGTALIFAGSRTQHRMAVNVEDAGFTLKDTIMWIYGSGFPKSMDISKQIDKNAEENTEAIRNKKECGNWLKNKRINLNLSVKEVSKHFPSFTGGLTGCVSNWECGNIPTWEHFSKLKSILSLDDSYDCLIEDRPKDSIEAEREVIGEEIKGSSPLAGNHNGKWNDDQVDGKFNITIPTTDEAKQWEGQGTAIKPAYEPIIIAMKPNDGTYANNALKHGVAGLNIDGCRVPLNGDKPSGSGNGSNGKSWNSFDGNDGNKTPNKGRFPSNIIHDGSKEVLDLFPETKSGSRSGEYGANGDVYGKYGNKTANLEGSSGSAERFFYCAKASKSERNIGCRTKKETIAPHDSNYRAIEDADWEESNGNYHPTVKPLALMEYLCKLVKQPTHNPITLDPFMGSNTTGLACNNLGIDYIGIERDPEYFKIAEQRISGYVPDETEYEDPEQIQTSF